MADYVKGELKSQDEILNCYWMERDELVKKIALGEITDGPTLIAYFYGMNH
jgi:NADH pyrophosphatase NudC (nudix superfamily)